MVKTILIVDDDLKNLKLVRDLLQNLGHTVLEATDGRQGVELATAKKPDLILMDIQLPVMDGFEATQTLKANAPTGDIPVIALTAYAMDKDKEKASEIGFNDYITKPFEVREFQKRITKILEAGNP